MRARLAYVLFSVLLLCALGEIAGAPSSGVNDILKKQDEEYQACCMKRRIKIPLSNCILCEPDVEPITEVPTDDPKTAFTTKCKGKHNGCTKI